MNEKVIETVAALKRRIHYQPEIGIILGSGLHGLADEVQNSVRVRYENIPHFPVSSVDGHCGEIVSGYLYGATLFTLSGRVHYYEGYSMQQVVFPIRVMAAFGVKTLIITNAAGAVNELYKPGDIVAISDHINLMGDNPLIGYSDFANLTEAYNDNLRNLAKMTAANLAIPLRSGVYVAFSGPSYETPSEIKAIRSIGADMVGMSTVPEVIMANSLGMKVLGLSIITNMAAGMSGKPLSHEEVIETSENASPKLKALAKGIIQQLNRRKKK
jgi:purine-nucleoside phosphorylase